MFIHKVNSRKCIYRKISKVFRNELLSKLKDKEISVYSLESELFPDLLSAVSLRRDYYSAVDFSEIPYEDFDYENIYLKNCENVIGYMSIPLGLIGPLSIDDEEIYVPFATTEGTLVASTQRGCGIIGNIDSMILDNGITKSPVIQFKNVNECMEFKKYMEDNYEKIKDVFDSTSSFASLIDIKLNIVGNLIYFRFKSLTGDAMGINMISKACEKVLNFFKNDFTKYKFDVISVSGNYCVEKKASNLNWVSGRGKSVVCESIISKEKVEEKLHTTVDDLVKLNVTKNLIGSSIAAITGGFNAHAANMVTAVFLACGQDIAQNVESSNCLTIMEKEENGDLYMSCTMPNIECGTVGGGTTLPVQKACLEIMGLDGSSEKDDLPSGYKAEKLSRITCAVTMCGELSFMSGTLHFYSTKCSSK